MSTVNKTTSRPKGLTLERKGGKFTLSWKISSANYDDGQDLQYVIITSQKKFDSAENFMKQGFKVSGLKWKNVSVGKKTTAKAISITLGDYYPNKDADDKYKPYLAGIIFRVRGNRKDETKTVKGKRVTYKYSVSDWSYYYYDTLPPEVPEFIKELSDQSNYVTYSWECNDATLQRINTDVEFETIAVKNTTGAYKTDDFWTDATKETKGQAGSYVGGGPSGEDFDISTDSWTRFVRVRARGAGGASDWVYLYNVFALPYAAKNVAAEAIKDEATNTFTCNVNWLADADFAHPIDNVLVEYAMETPLAGMQCPAEANWQTGDTRSDTTGSDRSTFSIDGLLGEDKCLFIRIVTEHKSTTNGNYASRSIPIIATRDGTGLLKDPEITALESYTDGNYKKVRITASNESDVPDARIIVSYKDKVNQEPIDIGVATNDTETVLYVPDWTGKEPKDFGVRAVVGTIDTKVRQGDNVSVVTVRNEIMRSPGIIWDNGTVPRAPENVSAVQTVDNDILVTWDWAWDEADSAEVSWADRENAWDSTDEPDTHIVSKARSSKLYISGLDTGQRYYVRVRLIKGSDDSAVYGEYSETQWVDLNSAPAIPELTLTPEVVTENSSFIASWSYVSTDGTDQDYAAISEVTRSGGEYHYGDPIAEVTDAQRISISSSRWPVGTEHALAVRVRSKSGRWSEWSTPKNITVAEPISCEIVSTSLESKEIELDPETKSGSLVTLNGGDDTNVRDVTSLQVALEPVQDNEYDSVWAGGNGKNKLPPTTANTPQTIEGITWTVNADGSVTASGTSTARSVFTYLFVSADNATVLNGSYKGVLGNGSNLNSMSSGIKIGDNWGGFNAQTMPVNGALTQVWFSLEGTGTTVNKTIYPMIVASTETSTVYTPWENIVPITAPTTSKNLIPYPYILGSNTVSGITYTDNGDGTLTINGTATASAFYDLGNASRNYFELPAGTYTFAGSGNAGVGVTLCKIVDGSGQFFKNANTSAVTFTTTESAFYYFYIVVNSGTTVDNLIVKPQLERGSVATLFRPYGENVQVIHTDTQYYDPADVEIGKNWIMGSDPLRAINVFNVTGGESCRIITSGGNFDNVLFIEMNNNTQITNFSVKAPYDNTVTLDPACNKIIMQFQQTTTITEDDFNGFACSVSKEYETYTTDLDTTVYGGNADVVNGTGTSAMGMVDAGTLNWLYYSAYNMFYVPLTGRAKGETNLICSAYPVGGVWAATNDNAIRGNTSNDTIYIKDTSYGTDTAAFKQAMSGVQICYELATPTDLTLTPQTVSLNEGTNNVWSEQGDVTIRTVDAVTTGLALTRMPLTVNITGAGQNGVVNVLLRRTESYVNSLPNGDDLRGYAGEVVARVDSIGDGEVEIPLERISGRLDDGAKYQIEATIQDNLNQKAEAVAIPFFVKWDDQAIMPEASVDIEDGVAKIAIAEMRDASEGAYCDIYRLSVDKPELIYHRADFNNTYVDPYPTIGEFGGYRVVYYTANGDYITADDTYAWEDYTEEEYESDEAIIDFNGEQLRLYYNVDADSSWAKDFKQTKYLGGAVQGDWKAGVSRTGTAAAVFISVTEADKFPKIRELAEWLGHCHVRTLDGSSYTADVQVSESNPHDKHGLVKSASLSITRIDPVDVDGMTLAEWEKNNVVE